MLIPMGWIELLTLFRLAPAQNEGWSIVHSVWRFQRL